MSALDQLSSVDRALAEMRREFEDEKNAIRDECRIATIERDLLREQLATTQANERRWQRIATQFVQQFDMVDKICSDVRTAAMAVRQMQEQEEYTQEQEAGNANAMASDTTDGADICPECFARPNEDHKPGCSLAKPIADEPLPEFLRNAKLDPEFQYAPPQTRAQKLLKRHTPGSEQG